MKDKKDSKESNFKLLYLLLVILCVLFLVLLLLSSSNTNIQKELNMETRVEVYNLEASNIVFGSLEVTNPSLLPKRVNLDSYVLCNLDNMDISTKLSSGQINLQYTNKAFRNYYYENFVDVGSNEKESLTLYTSYLPFNRFDNTFENETPIEIKYHLFSIEEDINKWDYCIDANIEEALSEITLVIK